MRQGGRFCRARDAGQKKGGDIREEVDGAAKNKQSREEDEIVWSFCRSGVIGRKIRSCDFNMGQMLQLHNQLFCNAAMQQEHRVNDHPVGGAPKIEANRLAPLAPWREHAMSLAAHSGGADGRNHRSNQSRTGAGAAARRAQPD